MKKSVSEVALKNRYQRLSLYDRGFLRIEDCATPQHFAGLCVVESGPLLDSTGNLDVEMVRRRLERRLSRAPELRRRLYRAGPLCGPSGRAASTVVTFST
jgi:hypothetical protein